MAVAVKMQALAPSMTEGNLVRWTKKEGEPVKAGETLVEIETDKALVECEAPADGVLAKILVPDGTERVAVDTLIAWLVAPGEAVPEAGAPAPAATGPAPAAAGATLAPTPAVAAQASAETLASDGRFAASPLARRLARQHGLALAAIRGSGPRGRIVRVDIETALRDAASRPVAVVATATSETKAAAIAAATPAFAAPSTAQFDEIPHTSMRRVIAQRLTEAKQQVPHFYLTVDCRIDALLALRLQVNATRDDDKISVNDFVVRAAALALRRVPAANASWTETAIRRWRSVDVSVAVATPGGLITPVVRNADEKTVSTLSAQIRELAARAKDNRLKPAEYQGGGFTVSNLGMYGIREFAAIINPPQACILAVGAGEQRPVVVDGALAVATVMTCTLSVDHRAVDGAVGAEFLAAFKALIEQPLSMLV